MLHVLFERIHFLHVMWFEHTGVAVANTIRSGSKVYMDKVMMALGIRQESVKVLQQSSNVITQRQYMFIALPMY